MLYLLLLLTASKSPTSHQKHFVMDANWMDQMHYKQMGFYGVDQLQLNIIIITFLNDNNMVITTNTLCICTFTTFNNVIFAVVLKNLNLSWLIFFQFFNFLELICGVSNQKHMGIFFLFNIITHKNNLIAISYIILIVHNNDSEIDSRQYEENPKQNIKSVQYKTFIKFRYKNL